MCFDLSSNASVTRFVRYVLIVSLFSVGYVARAATAPVVQQLEAVYLYSSPITAAFFSANGTSYDGLKQRWREYFRPYGRAFREVSRANLISGLKPGVLVLGSAALLDEQERKAIEAFAEAGGSILATWGTGIRDGRGHWTGYRFLENLFEMKVNSVSLTRDNGEISSRFLNPFGDAHLSWSLPSGERIFLGEVAETPIRVDSPRLAARYFSWERYPAPKNGNGAIAYLEKGASRRVYFGFAESSWEYDERIEIPNLVDAVMAWLKHEPSIYKGAWPNANRAAQLLEMDTEDQYVNALDFAKHLDAVKLHGTFYSLTGVARQYREVASKLAEKNEIGYHGDVHVGFKGKTVEVQEKRLNAMLSEMQDTVGVRALPKVTGFRAPTESFDSGTEKLLRKIGVRHNVTGPSASERRVPFFSEAEPGLATEDAIVGLPRTQMDDLNYLGLRVKAAQATELMMLEFDYLYESGALGVLSVHSQNYGVGDLMTKMVPIYLQRLSKQADDVWVASGEEISSWWRARERVVHRSTKDGSTRLAFEVRAPGNVRGLTFYVTHPSLNKLPRSVVPEGANAPQPEIRPIDAYRSALVFSQELKTGSYAYKLEF